MPDETFCQWQDRVAPVSGSFLRRWFPWACHSVHCTEPAPVFQSIRELSGFFLFMAETVRFFQIGNAIRAGKPECFVKSDGRNIGFHPFFWMRTLLDVNPKWVREGFKASCRLFVRDNHINGSVPGPWAVEISLKHGNDGWIKVLAIRTQLQYVV